MSATLALIALVCVWLRRLGEWTTIETVGLCFAQGTLAIYALDRFGAFGP